MHRAALFDLDGTLVDTAPDLCGTIADMQTDRGLPAMSLQSLSHLASGGARALLGAGFGVMPIDATFEPLRLEFLERYEARIARESTPYAGIVPMLHALNTHQVPLGVVTKKPHYLAKQLMQALGLLDLCPVLVGGDSTPSPKPSPLPCLLAAESLKLNPQTCVMIGDDARDITAGKAANMHTVAVRYGYLASDIASWGADVIVDTPTQLHEWLMNTLNP